MVQSWFTPTPFQTRRLKTTEVKVANISMGKNYPVRVQSMANTPTHNVKASVKQAVEIIEAGGELVRFTVINSKDAEALNEIKKTLVIKGYKTPIVADVHFNPALADIAAKYVDKVRINAGNYIDKRATFVQVDFSDKEYLQELAALKERFITFLNICKEHKTAIRIGTNHGSLSDRIMSRYGDTPNGMVEATMEFLRICKTQNFKNVVVSLKSSNTRVMVQAYRLLALQMQVEEMEYCLHLGVTEAGSGEDGRIKSAVGIGALMNDGLGDTIRVSLTEHPAKEIPVAKALVKHFETLSNVVIGDLTPAYNPYEYNSRQVNNILTRKEPVVVADLSKEPEITRSLLEELNFVFNETTKVIEQGDISPDVIYSGEHIFPYSVPENTTLLIDFNYWDNQLSSFPLFSWNEYVASSNKSEIQNWIQVDFKEIDSTAIELIKTDPTVVLVCFSYQKNETAEQRALINLLMTNGCKAPVIIQRNYNEPALPDFQLKSAADTGIFFIDGLANGLWLKNTFKENINAPVETAFAILQASRSRTTKTEYISCPGCGRTLFELEKILAEIKASTQKLKGLKIAVMGCIVNGPGEMADADFGYVGSGPGKVSLYKGKNVVKRDIDTNNAVAELLKLIENNI